MAQTIILDTRMQTKIVNYKFKRLYLDGEVYHIKAISSFKINYMITKTVLLRTALNQ